jgi:hypothetical protein
LDNPIDFVPEAQVETLYWQFLAQKLTVQIPPDRLKILIYAPLVTLYPSTAMPDSSQSITLSRRHHAINWLVFNAGILTCTLSVMGLNLFEMGNRTVTCTRVESRSVNCLDQKWGFLGTVPTAAQSLKQVTQANLKEYRYPTFGDGPIQHRIELQGQADHSLYLNVQNKIAVHNQPVINRSSPWGEDSAQPSIRLQGEANQSLSISLRGQMSAQNQIVVAQINQFIRNPQSTQATWQIAEPPNFPHWLLLLLMGGTAGWMMRLTYWVIAGSADDQDTVLQEYVLLPEAQQIKVRRGSMLRQKVKVYELSEVSNVALIKVPDGPKRVHPFSLHLILESGEPLEILPITPSGRLHPALGGLLLLLLLPTITVSLPFLGLYLIGYHKWRRALRPLLNDWHQLLPIAQQISQLAQSPLQLNVNDWTFCAARQTLTHVSQTGRTRTFPLTGGTLQLKPADPAEADPGSEGHLNYSDTYQISFAPPTGSAQIIQTYQVDQPKAGEPIRVYQQAVTDFQHIQQFLEAGVCC